MHKILWLASWYPNRINPFDGDFVQRHARAAALVQPVHVVHVVKDGKGSAGTQVEETRQGSLRETIIYYTPVATGWKPLDALLSFVKYFRVYRNFLRQDFTENGMPALVHVQVAMRAGLIAQWLKKKWGLKYLVTEHWTGYYRYSNDNYWQRGFLFRYLTRSILSKASLLLPVSRNLGETIQEEVFPVPYAVVPNVAETSLFRYSESRPPVFRFIHVSSMSYQKNIPGLLHAFKAMASLESDWECRMIGPATEELKKLSVNLGLQDRIRWAGEIPYAAVAAEMQQASAFVLFSRYETFSCVLIEAACCGLPVIAPAIGPLPEIVHAENGILTEPGNEESLAAGMARMIREYEKFDRKKISERAVCLFNYERIGDQIKSIYQSML